MAEVNSQFFPDYPKYGAWADSYVITTKEFGATVEYGIGVGTSPTFPRYFTSSISVLTISTQASPVPSTGSTNSRPCVSTMRF